MPGTKVLLAYRNISRLFLYARRLPMCRISPRQRVVEAISRPATGRGFSCCLGGSDSHPVANEVDTASIKAAAV
jgi:hypothetical protein